MSKKTFFIDLKRAAFGTLDLELSGPPGTVVEAAIGECAVHGRLDRVPGGWRCFKKAEFCLQPGVTHYEFPIPPFRSGNRGAAGIPSPLDREVAPFRYVEVTGECRVLDVRRKELFPAEFHDEDSEFHSADERLNKVWEFCKYSIRATAAFGIFIDGERERLPYEGDAYINQLGWFCSSSDGTIPRRTIEYLLVHPTWPQEWRLLMPRIVEDYLLYTGDHTSLRRWKEVLETRLMRYAWTPEGLLPAQTEELCNLTNVRTIIDWPKAEQDGSEFAPVMLVSNCYLYGALLAMHRLYGEEKYRSEAEHLKQLLRAQMLRNGLFTDHAQSTHSALHSLMFPVVFGVADDAELLHLGAEMRSRGMACSVYGAQFLLEALCRCGEENAAFQLLTSGGPRSWLGMLEAGSTITMEAWSNDTKPNQDWTHAWGAASANIIPRCFCGIRPVEPGFVRFVVEPRNAGVPFVLRHPTVHGEIRLEYSGNEYHLHVPRDTAAQLPDRLLPPGEHHFHCSPESGTPPLRLR